MSKRTMDLGATAIYNGNFGTRLKLASDDAGGGAPAPVIDKAELATLINAAVAEAVKPFGEQLNSVKAGNREDYDSKEAYRKRDAAQARARELEAENEALKAAVEAKEAEKVAAIARIGKAEKLKEALKAQGITHPDKVLKLADFDDAKVDALEVAEDGSFKGFEEMVKTYVEQYPEYHKPIEGEPAPPKPPVNSPPGIVAKTGDNKHNAGDTMDAYSYIESIAAKEMKGR